jgi:hypothetical protein
MVNIVENGQGLACLDRRCERLPPLLVVAYRRRFDCGGAAGRLFRDHRNQEAFAAPGLRRINEPHGNIADDRMSNLRRNEQRESIRATRVICKRKFADGVFDNRSSAVYVICRWSVWNEKVSLLLTGA